MSMWQDNSLQRITRLEEQIAEQAYLLHQMADLLMDVSALVVTQTAKETQPYVRGTQY